MTHWARQYIGKPWAPDGNGPAAFSCWGLVRHVFRSQHGIDFPPVTVGPINDALLDNVRAIKRAAQVSGWRPIVSDKPLDGDIVLMRSLVQIHCGLGVRANGRVGVLHSTHQTGVIWQPWDEAIAGMAAELWRRVQ